MTAAVWEILEGLTPGTAVVHPLGDLIRHDVDGEDRCACGPRVEPVSRPDGSMGWLYVHHSLDGRETREPPAQERK